MKARALTKFGLLIVAAGLLSACATTPAPTRARLLALSPLPTATVEAASTATPSASLLTPDATASPAPTPAPSLTPLPSPRLRQLTSGGCCTDAFWSADSRYVQFIDRPASRPLGVYQVSVTSPGPPSLVTERIVNSSGQGAFYVYPDGDTAVVQNVETGEAYVIDNGGRPVSVSPDGQRLLWQVIEQEGDFDRRRGAVWVANVDGGDARVVAETVGFGDSQWLGERRILLVGLPLDDLPFVAIAALTLGEAGQGDTLVQLAQVARPRGTLVSPGNGWLVYYLTFQARPGDDGLWVVPTDGQQPPRKLDFFGGYRWRDDTRLLYVPLEPGVGSHTLWEYDARDGTSRRLTDPAQTSFKIANNDWAVSPDGRYVVFVNSADHNLWLLELMP